MIKKDIVEKASEKITEEPRIKVQQAVDKIFDEIKNTLLRGEKSS
jgi:nucleoid DNA-binding protein